MYINNSSLKPEKQMTIPFNITAKFEIMGYEKLSKLISKLFERLIDLINLRHMDFI
jgi:hypothetical protein